MLFKNTSLRTTWKHRKRNIYLIKGELALNKDDFCPLADPTEVTETDSDLDHLQGPGSHNLHIVDMISVRSVHLV